LFCIDPPPFRSITTSSSLISLGGFLNLPSLPTRADLPARDDDPAAVEGEPLLAEDLVDVDD
jgi:hypothetical protein